jgi:phosphopantetheinyl transferase
LAIARRYFCAREAADVEAGGADDVARRFVRYWTAKEACVKARGGSLAMDIGTSEIVWQSGDPHTGRLKSAEAAAHTQVVIRLPLTLADWVAAVAAEGDDWQTTWMSP